MGDDYRIEPLCTVYGDNDQAYERQLSYWHQSVAHEGMRTTRLEPPTFYVHHKQEYREVLHAYERHCDQPPLQGALVVMAALFEFKGHNRPEPKLLSVGPFYALVLHALRYHTVLKCDYSINDMTTFAWTLEGTRKWMHANDTTTYLASENDSSEQAQYVGYVARRWSGGIVLGPQPASAALNPPTDLTEAIRRFKPMEL